MTDCVCFGAVTQSEPFSPKRIIRWWVIEITQCQLLTSTCICTHEHLYIYMHIHIHVHTYIQKKLILLWQGHASFSLLPSVTLGTEALCSRTISESLGAMADLGKMALRSISQGYSRYNSLRSADLKKNGNDFWDIEKNSACYLYWSVSRKKK